MSIQFLKRFAGASEHGRECPGLFFAVARSGRLPVSGDRVVARAADPRKHCCWSGDRCRGIADPRLGCGIFAQTAGPDEGRSVRAHAQSAVFWQRDFGIGHRSGNSLVDRRAAVVRIFRAVLLYRDET
jgi:hypothetical protein